MGSGHRKKENDARKGVELPLHLGQTTNSIHGYSLYPIILGEVFQRDANAVLQRAQT
jgi:hypothetical protein